MTSHVFLRPDFEVLRCGGEVGKRDGEVGGKHPEREPQRLKRVS